MSKDTYCHYSDLPSPMAYIKNNMKKFEYKIIYELRNESFEDMLNRFGSEGWELVKASDRPNTLTGLAIFKREIDGV